MPRLPPSNFNFNSKARATRLSAEEQQLERLQAENLRQQQTLEKRLKRLPVELAAQQEKKRAQTHQRAVAAGRAISSGTGRRKKGERKKLPSRRRWAAQIKTLVLLAALALIFILLWHSFPSITP